MISKIGRRRRKAELVVFPKEEGSPKHLVLAGCDGGIGLLPRIAEKLTGVEVVSASASNKLALTWLMKARCIWQGSI